MFICAKKLLEYNRAKARAQEEKEVRERRERVARAQEANKRAAEERQKCQDTECADEDCGMPGGDQAGGFGLGPFTELFKEFADDPEMLQELKNNPTLITKVLEIFQNPSAIMKHMNDPGVQKLMSKLGSRMGGGGFPGAGFPGFGGGPGPDFGANDAKTSSDVPPEPKAPKKAPEPDLD